MPPPNNDGERISLIPNGKHPTPDASFLRRFSFKKLWAFTGPGFLMSIGFLDPGNVTSDLQSGALVQYELLWVLLGATIIGLILQRLSARLGVVTKLHLAELCFMHYKRPTSLFLWIMAEIAIISSDIQYKLGMAIAIYSLSRTLIPLWAGVLLTTVDLLVFSYFDQHGLRKLEFFFGVLILIMAVTFGYEFVVSRPDPLLVFEGIVIPRCRNCTSAALLQAVSIIGSNLVPHNLFLHSAMVKSRNVNSSNRTEVSEANFYFFLESGLALAVSFFINLFIVSVLGNELYHKTNHDIRHQCEWPANATRPFPNNYDTVSPDLYTAGLVLGCIFGATATYIWSIGILASAQSATMTVTYAGQYVLEGFLNLQLKAWQRALFCRVISIIPTFLFAFYFDTGSLTNVSTALNTVISIQLPFAMLPTIAFTSSPSIMGEFVNSRLATVVSMVLASAIICINIFFVFRFVENLGWYVLAPVALFGGIYVMLYVYLVMYVIVARGTVNNNICNYLFVPAERNH